MKREIAIRATVGIVICGLLLTGCTGSPSSVTEQGEVFTVMFDSRGGSKIKSQNIAKGDKVVEPPVPTRGCECEFDGWYVGDEKWSFKGYVVTEDMTLTAKWIECFGLNSKEIEIVEGFVRKFGDGKYTWSDIDKIERCDLEDDCNGYRIVYKNGKSQTVGIAKKLVEE